MYENKESVFYIYHFFYRILGTYLVFRFIYVYLFLKGDETLIGKNIKLKA